jgi:hypothetical protein
MTHTEKQIKDIGQSFAEQKGEEYRNIAELLAGLGLHADQITSVLSKFGTNKKCAVVYAYSLLIEELYKRESEEKEKGIQEKNATLKKTTTYLLKPEEQSDTTTARKSWFDRYKNKSRLVGAGIYFLVAVVLFCFIMSWPNYFYNQPLCGFENWRRLIWCFMWSFVGFSIIAYKSSLGSHPNNAWPSYATSYLVILVHIALITFSVLQSFPRTQNYVFYFLSAPICFSLSYLIDGVLKEKLKIVSSVLPK